MVYRLFQGVLRDQLKVRGMNARQGYAAVGMRAGGQPAVGDAGNQHLAAVYTSKRVHPSRRRAASAGGDTTRICTSAAGKKLPASAHLFTSAGSRRPGGVDAACDDAGQGLRVKYQRFMRHAREMRFFPSHAARAQPARRQCPRDADTGQFLYQLHGRARCRDDALQRMTRDLGLDLVAGSRGKQA